MSRHYVPSPSTYNRSLAVRAAAFLTLALTAVAAAQPSYTFTSLLDGVDWPESPTGLQPFDSFFTPDDIEIYNYTGNNLFFDSQYQVVGNAPGIVEDAIWANPIDEGFGNSVDFSFYIENVQSVGFDFAWAMAGAPNATPQVVEVYLEDSEGRATYEFVNLTKSFSGFGGVTGWADRLYFEAASLSDEYLNVDGGPFVDIRYVFVFVYAIGTDGQGSEFAIDNLQVNGDPTPGGEIVPSVNGGTVNISGGGLAWSILRGPGAFTMNLEVTNSTNSHAFYSTLLQPGGSLTNLGQVSGGFIGAGQTIYTPPLLSVNRLLPSGEYSSQILLVNDNNPLDPDDSVSFYARLFDPPALSHNSPVNALASQPIQLSNDLPPMNGYRASVKVVDRFLVGPFEVTGLTSGTAVKPGDTVQATPWFNRYGRLSNTYNGTFGVSLEMTAHSGVNNIEIFLFESEPVPNVNWTLNANLPDILTDALAFAPGDPLGPNKIGVNSSTIAATVLEGSAAYNGTLSATLAAAPEGATTSVIGPAATLDFSGGVPVYVVQLTYDEAALCGGMDEFDLRPLYYDANSGDWRLASDGNVGGSYGTFPGSFEAFKGTLGGLPISTALGTVGYDMTTNQVWAIVNHEATFGVGELGVSCHVPIPGDADGDGDVDEDDIDAFAACASRDKVPHPPGCDAHDYDNDNDVDMNDFGVVQRCFSGANVPGNPNCAN